MAAKEKDVFQSPKFMPRTKTMKNNLNFLIVGVFLSR